MATRAVLQVFEKYQKERVTFVTTVAEMAKNPQVRWSQQPARALIYARGHIIYSILSRIMSLWALT